jgi:hypothetical protein
MVDRRKLIFRIVGVLGILFTLGSFAWRNRKQDEEE